MRTGGRGEGGSAKSDLKGKRTLIKHLMMGVKKGQKSSDVKYRRPPRVRTRIRNVK